MQTYSINEEQRQEILKYMWAKPYGEVYRLMDTLLKLKENKDESGQEQETKEVWLRCKLT